MRPELALKEVVEGVFSRSVRVRAIKRRRRVFSLGSSHVSDRGKKPGGPSSHRKWSREFSAVLCECERRNVRDVYSPWGAVTSVTEGNEAGRPELTLKEAVGIPTASLSASEGTRTHTHEGTRS